MAERERDCPEKGQNYTPPPHAADAAKKCAALSLSDSAKVTDAISVLFQLQLQRNTKDPVQIPGPHAISSSSGAVPHQRPQPKQSSSHSALPEPASSPDYEIKHGSPKATHTPLVMQSWAVAQVSASRPSHALLQRNVQLKLNAMFEMTLQS